MSSQLPAIRSAVRPFLEKLEAGDRIVVAVSGGADSLALAYALSMEIKKLAIQLSAVTIDHQLQSKSGEQANQVVVQMKELGIECNVVKVNVEITDGSKDIMLFADSGKSIRFSEKDARPMGRVSQGVRGMKIEKGQKVISLLVLEEGNILTATENGYGKRSSAYEYRVSGRGGQGIINIISSERNGGVASTFTINHEDQIMLITDKGQMIRCNVKDIRITGRNTQGVRIFNLSDDEKVVSAARVEDSSEENN